jgi:predicted Zn-dependent protease
VGHTLGLLHHEDRRIIMNPAYDPEQAEFSEYEQQIVMRVLESRLAARDQEFPENADLLPLVVAMPATEGSDAERARLLDLVKRRAQYGSGKRAAKDAVELTDADVGAFNRAVAALNNGHPDEAWKLLGPVIEHTRARKVGGNTWTRIAELAAAIGALTSADDAASRAGALPAAQKIASEIESTRHRIALPLDAVKFGVPPEREPAYVSGYWATTKLVDGSDVPAARARLGELAAAFPEAPGVDVLACDLELKAKHAPVASKRCEAALAKFKGATRAHYLLAMIAIRARRDAVAEQHFRQAVLLDPADPSNWRALAQFYRATGATKRLAALASEHQTLLSSPLPE